MPWRPKADSFSSLVPFLSSQAPGGRERGNVASKASSWLSFPGAGRSPAGSPEQSEGGDDLPFSKVMAAKKVKHKAQQRGTSPHANNRAEIGFTGFVQAARIQEHVPSVDGLVRHCAGGPKKARCGTEIRRKV